LPLTNNPEHICFFRHALALDERRVKFLPEYVRGGVFEGELQDQQNEPEKHEHPSASTTRDPEVKEEVTASPPAVKEVWFPGTHSDM